ncbi:MAG: hypothetical protein AB9888_00090 [Bacteroidales bacterium]
MVGGNMAYSDVIDAIEKLPRYREFICPNCGKAQKAYSLIIQTNCQACGTRMKLRGYGAIGTEVEDVIDTVLLWLGENEDFSNALQRKQELDSEEE